MTPSVRALCRCAALFVITLPATVLPAQAPVQRPQDAGCVQQDGGYTCNLAGLKLALEHSRTIAAVAQRLDRTALHQLQHLAVQLGKVPVEASSPADLTFYLEPSTPPGVVLGPSDHELAVLRVTAPGADGPPVLLWVETLRGQGDRPWPAQVHSLVEQFQAHLTGGR